MNLYIHGSGILSAAGSNDQEVFLKDAPDYLQDRLLCKEPDYTSHIPPMQLRRMSKAVRMGIGASKICMQNSSSEKADAISVGTAFGCLQDTEFFLAKMTDQDEQMLTPTSFIQSTHNTVAGQIALVTGCHGHNLTYTHRGHSFEHAMLNAQLYLNDHKGENILVGGIEELTTSSFTVMQQLFVYRDAPSSPHSILHETKKGSIAGEGASFFLVKKETEHQGALCIKDIYTFVEKDEHKASEKIEEFIKRQSINIAAIDLVVLGMNGDENNAAFYKELRQNIFNNNSHAAFKHICGEYPVASSFALGMIVHAIKNGMPASTILNHAPKQMKRIMIVNNFGNYYSCWYLEVE